MCSLKNKIIKLSSPQFVQQNISRYKEILKPEYFCNLVMIIIVQTFLFYTLTKTDPIVTYSKIPYIKELSERIRHHILLMI
ncbi:unnamed protein product, partial [Callosobruchus maculatus]